MYLVPQPRRFGERALPLGYEQVEDGGLVFGGHPRQRLAFAPDQHRHSVSIEGVALAPGAGAAAAQRRPPRVHLVHGLAARHEVLR